MGKLKSKSELAKDATEIFEGDETLEYVFATGDGNIFLPQNENAAKMHGNANDLKVYEIPRPDGEGLKIEDQRIAELIKFESIEAIQLALELEVSSKVKRAGLARINELLEAKAAAQATAEAEAKEAAIKAAKKPEAKKALEEKGKLTTNS